MWPTRISRMEYLKILLIFEVCYVGMFHIKIMVMFTITEVRLTKVNAITYFIQVHHLSLGWIMQVDGNIHLSILYKTRKFCVNSAVHLKLQESWLTFFLCLMAISCSCVGIFSEMRCLPAWGMWPLLGSTIAIPASESTSDEETLTEVPS